MKGQHEVKVRAIDKRGSFQINQRVEANDPMDAIATITERFGISNESLIFVHAEPSKDLKEPS